MSEVKWGWKKTRSIFAAVVVSSAVVGMASTAMAGTRGQSEQDLKSMVEQLKQTVQTLEQKLAVMEENQTAADKAIQEVANQKNDSGLLLPDNTTMKLYGYAKLDAMWTDQDGGGKFAYTPSAVLLDKDEDAHADNAFLMHARQTRLGFATSTDTPYGKFNTKIEGDFYGSGGNEVYSNSWGFRLRRAYGELGNFLIGQEWSTFVDLAAYPETIDFGGAVGSLFIRQAMIRYSQGFEGGSFQFAIENPESNFATKTIDANGVESDASFGSGNEVMPDIIARLNLDPAFGHFSVVGMLRRLSYDGVPFAGNTFGYSAGRFGEHSDAGHGPSDDTLGYAVSLNAVIPTFGKDNFHFEANYGTALGRYLTAGFQEAFVNPLTLYSLYLILLPYLSLSGRSP
ncbi:MAG: hypothetical protein DSY58_09205 [Desulfobulbus sp.]|nr:MAG: hypothetical protein DSY58_09205 [Desulfobulbus sp.]